MSDAHVSSDGRLAYMDQASFLGLRATGLGQLAQWVWVYERAIDMAALTRFHRNLGYGLLGRRIERSPLPFGRDHWVDSPVGLPIDVAERRRLRAELSDWADEHAQLPIDPESGPGWRLGVLSLTDGATAVSLSASHSLVDGLASCEAIADAVEGNRRDLGLPPPRSRTGLREIVADAHETVRCAPEVGRALAALVRLARSQRTDRPRAESQSHPDRDGGEAIVIPATVVHVDLTEWDKCAKALGGNSNSLLNGLAARLGERIGRRSQDAAVGVRFAVSDRIENDTRANALSFTNIDIDPNEVTSDLSGTSRAVKDALIALRRTPDEAQQVLPLTPLTPKWVVRQMATTLFDDLSVGSSNLGDIDPAIGRIDGTAADYIFVRPVTQHMTRRTLEQIRGQLSVTSGRMGDKIFITVVGYQPGRTNSKSALRELVAQALSDFNLAGEFG